MSIGSMAMGFGPRWNMTPNPSGQTAAMVGFSGPLRTMDPFQLWPAAPIAVRHHASI